MNRFFRTSPGVYTQVRAGLDAAFGHPYSATAEDGTVVVTASCLAAVGDLHVDAEGRVYCSVLKKDCRMEQVEPVLASLIQQGAIEEISEGVFYAEVSADAGDF